jgi:hypothetical protein
VYSRRWIRDRTRACWTTAASRAKGSQDDEAGREAQRAADGVETLVQPGVVEIAVELADAEPEPDQSQGGADPRHERPISGLPAPFSRELGAGVDHGGER